MQSPVNYFQHGHSVNSEKTYIDNPLLIIAGWVERVRSLIGRLIWLWLLTLYLFFNHNKRLNFAHECNTIFIYHSHNVHVVCAEKKMGITIYMKLFLNLQYFGNFQSNYDGYLLCFSV